MAIDRGSGGSISGQSSFDSANQALAYAQAAAASANSAATIASTTANSVKQSINGLNIHYIVDTITASTNGQTLFSGITPYTIGVNALYITINGIDQTGSFTETSTTSITFSEGLNSGDVVIIRQAQLVIPS